MYGQTMKPAHRGMYVSTQMKRTYCTEKGGGLVNTLCEETMAKKTNPSAEGVSSYTVREADRQTGGQVGPVLSEEFNAML